MPDKLKFLIEYFEIPYSEPPKWDGPLSKMSKYTNKVYAYVVEKDNIIKSNEKKIDHLLNVLELCSILSVLRLDQKVFSKNNLARFVGTINRDIKPALNKITKLFVIHEADFDQKKLMFLETSKSKVEYVQRLLAKNNFNTININPAFRYIKKHGSIKKTIVALEKDRKKLQLQTNIIKSRLLDLKDAATDFLLSAAFAKQI